MKSFLDYDWTTVINFESGGENYYNKYLKSVSWPGGASGLTIGIGADLGYMSRQEFDKYFSSFFSREDSAKLISVIGLKGDKAKAKLSFVKGIKLEWADAMDAFLNWTLPKFWNLTNNLWPGVDALCEVSQVALVSLVFNRGASTKGSSRVEMKNIGNLVRQKDYISIASEIRSMKRLWLNKNLDGLLKRREIEATMVETCVS
jgi:GH24 family phage-related lysozyme (muramidase)